MFIINHNSNDSNQHRIVEQQKTESEYERNCVMSSNDKYAIPVLLFWGHDIVSSPLSPEFLKGPHTMQKKLCHFSYKG